MAFEFFVAKKYVKSKQKTNFVTINLINYISTIGVMIGTAALVIALSVANGFENEVRSSIIGFAAHVKLGTFHDRGMENYEQILARVDSVEHVIGAAPFIEEKALVASATRKDFISIKAIDPELEKNVTTLVDNIVKGELDLGVIEVEGERSYPGIILGRWLADKLDVTLTQRVQVLIASGLALRGPLAQPRWRTFRVSGVFETGLFDYDNMFAFISIKSGQKLTEKPDKISGIQIKLDDIDNSGKVADILNEKIGFPTWARTWFSMHRNLFSWIAVERMMIFFILSLIIIVATFNIIGSLIMVVMEKRQDIGILKSMGAMGKSIQRIFMYQGLVAGLIGASGGLILGYLVCWSQVKFKWLSLPGDVYIIDAVPIKMQTQDFVMVAVAAILLSLLATIYPAYKASKLDPIDAIREK